MITLFYVLKNALIIGLLLIPFIAYFVGKKYRLPMSLVYLLACVLCYGLIVAEAWATDVYLNAVLMTHDLDGNDFFSPDEITPAQQQAMHDVISDTGRALAVFTGAVVSPIWVGLVFLGGIIVSKIIRFFR